MAKLLWVTNVPAPYRVPVWQEICRLSEFRILLMASNEHNRHWSLKTMNGVPFTLLHTIKRRRGETTHYTSISLDWIKEIAHCETVILPSWENPLAWQMLAMSKLLGKRTIGFYESTLLTQRFASGIAANARSCFFRHVDRVLTVGASSSEAMKAMGVPSEKITEGFNCVDVLAIEKQAALLRAQADDSRKGHRFIYVGQLIERKNVDQLIHAFCDIARPEDLLTIVGEGPESAELKQLATARNCEGQIVFEGYVQHDEIPRKLAIANTLVLPSKEEVWGLVVNEALACGLQVVVTGRCGVAAEVGQFPGVFVCEPDASSLASALNDSRASWAGYRPPPAGVSPADLAATIVGDIV